jgi:2,3-bisphosphoglycerate-independent phosphoglycerate mutase
MSADEVGNNLLKVLQDNPYDLIILNFANADMVGHTGRMAAAIKAVETVDKNLGKIIDKITEIGGKAIITADHGNAEKMLDPESGKPFTAHSTNKVPLIIVGEDHISLESEGRLSDIASTLLKMMDMEPPIEFTGKPLFKREE